MSDDLTRHPLSEVWGDMPDKDFRELVEDVRKNGVRQPVTLYEGRVLDGWHRYRAALEAGVDPPFEDYAGDDPGGFVISANLHRRHLNPIGRAKIVARARRWAPVGKPRQVAELGERVHTTAEMAAEANVPHRTMERGKAEVRRERSGEVPPPKRKPKLTAEDALTHKDRLIQAAKAAKEETRDAKAKHRAEAKKLREKVTEAKAEGREKATVLRSREKVWREEVDRLKAEGRAEAKELRENEKAIKALRAERDSLKERNAVLQKAVDLSTPPDFHKAISEIVEADALTDEAASLVRGGRPILEYLAHAHALTLSCLSSG